MDQNYQVDYHSGGHVAGWTGNDDGWEPGSWWDTGFTFLAFAAYGLVAAAAFAAHPRSG